MFVHVSNFTAFGLFAPQQDKVRNPAACAVFSARPAGVKPGGLAEERWAEAIKTGRKALAVEMASRECFGRAGNIEPAATSWR